MTTPYGHDPYGRRSDAGGESGYPPPPQYGQQPQYGQPQYGQPQYEQPYPGDQQPQPVYGGYPQPGYGGYPPPGYAGYPPPGYGGYPRPQQSRVSDPATGWALLGLAVLGVIGSAGTWASFDYLGFHESINGTGNGKDGTITIVLMVLGAVGGLLMGIKQGRLWVPITALVMTALTTLTAVVDIADISNGINGVPDSAISVGWGLWVTLVAGILGSGAAIFGLVRRD